MPDAETPLRSPLRTGPAKLAPCGTIPSVAGYGTGDVLRVLRAHLRTPGEFLVGGRTLWTFTREWLPRSVLGRRLYPLPTSTHLQRQINPASQVHQLLDRRLSEVLVTKQLLFGR